MFAHMHIYTHTSTCTQAKQYIADLNEVRAACEKAMRDRDTALTEKQVLSQNLEKAQSEVEALRKKRQTAKSKNKMAENHQLRQVRFLYSY